MPLYRDSLSPSLIGAANGVASLGSDGKVPSGQLPAPASGTSTPAAGFLAPWREKLISDPANAKIAFVGDSTRDSAAAGSAFYSRMVRHITPGGLLGGMADANLLNLAQNGGTVASITNAARMESLAAASPNLVEVSMGINDMRVSGSPNVDVMESRLIAGIEAIRAAVPGVPIIATIPNPLLAVNDGYVTPYTDAQAKSNVLRGAYLRLIDRWPDVLIRDTAWIFGTTSHTSLPTTGYWSDSIHPNGVALDASTDALAALVGYSRPLSLDSVAQARAASAYSPWSVYGREVEHRGLSVFGREAQDGPRYVLIGEGRYSNLGAGSYLDFVYPYGRAGNIQPGDIIELPEGSSFALTSFSLATPGSNSTRILSSLVPTPTQTLTSGRGIVKIWRRSTPLDTAVADAALDTSWRFKRIARVQSAGSGAQTYLDLDPASLTVDVPTQPSSEWVALIQNGDRVYVDGNGSTYYTVGTDCTVAVQGSRIRIGGLASANRTAFVNRLAVIVGTHA